MFKGKPFLIASLVFGGLGIIVLVLTVVSFFCGDQLISSAISSMLNLEKGAFTDTTMAQIAVVLFLPTFIFAYRSFADNDSDTKTAPAVAADAGNVRTNVSSAEFVAANDDDISAVLTEGEVSAAEEPADSESTEENTGTEEAADIIDVSDEALPEAADAVSSDSAEV